MRGAGVFLRVIFTLLRNLKKKNEGGILRTVPISKLRRCGNSWTNVWFWGHICLFSYHYGHNNKIGSIITSYLKMSITLLLYIKWENSYPSILILSAPPFNIQWGKKLWKKIYEMVLLSKLSNVSVSWKLACRKKKKFFGISPLPYHCFQSTQKSS